ncbi:MAG: FadR/GntR family transcriptional regulator, partial [candidate division NC10 bacterium]|nr:FadR/GntR family transcriptional regulator [candidate division NC10 bacterium]
LPSHDLLSKEMGVSRSTLREGLKNLALMGVLEMKPGQGTRIRSLSPSSLMHNLAPSLLMDRATVMELMDARLVVELGTVALACKNVDPTDLEKMEELVQEMEGYLQTKDYGRYSELDLRFHFAVAHASKNRVLQRILEDIRGLLSQLLKEVVLYLPGMAETGNQFHKQILNALRSKDPASAEETMRSHIVSVSSAVKKYQRVRTP